VAVQRLKRLIEEYGKAIKRTPIAVTLKIDVPDSVIREFTEFYANIDLGAFDM